MPVRAARYRPRRATVITACGPVPGPARARPGQGNRPGWRTAVVAGSGYNPESNGEKIPFGSPQARLKEHVNTISTNWEKVIAESVFKYAGSTYKSLVALEDVSNENLSKEFSNYMKYWAERKGFSMALQVGKNNLGATAAELNRLIGFGPVTMNNSYVTGVDSNGNYAMDRRRTWGDYQLHMLKIQKMMVDEFGVKARNNDQLSELEALASSLSATESAETD